MKYRHIFAALGLAAVLTAAAADENRVPFNGLILDSAMKPVSKVKVYINDPNYFARSDKSGLPTAQEDEELVNTGYGYVKRREYTGSSKGISGESLRRSGRTSLLEALSGMVAGLTINRVDGRLVPNIRGQRSLMLSNEPLYIIDGTEVESLENVNIFEVDHVEVLKEASIYGSRGANGAIVVTTNHFKF